MVGQHARDWAVLKVSANTLSILKKVPTFYKHAEGHAETNRQMELISA